ncbi:MAG TPA: lantibiotic dehydratase [Blastocatellia bacterium]|nr:lantibiotic dehydratase [Blastocatellia bacterium]
MDVEMAVSSRHELADHLVPLQQGQWALWRCVCLRGAGFPAVQVLSLASPDCANAADSVLGAEVTAEQSRRGALEQVRQRLGEMPVDQPDTGERRGLRRVLKILKAGKMPGDVEPGLRECVARFRAAKENVSSLMIRFREAHTASVYRVSEAINSLAQDDSFCEAMVWQNRRAYNCAKSSLSATPGGPRNQSRRYSEHLLASYLQRYCTKNDSIGFFGPIGWADLNPEKGEAILVRPGPGLIAVRAVYFEGWAIDALAQKLAADKEIRLWAVPRVPPYIRIEGGTLHLPYPAQPSILPPNQAAVLRACGQRRTAKEIAQGIVASNTGIRGEAEVYRILETLETRGLITWTFEIPIAPNPERALRAQLMRIGSDELRERALAPLLALDEARESIADCAGNSQAVDQALESLEREFTRSTAREATRSHGQLYAARTLVYEDSRRDVEVTIGPELIESLSAPLSLILTSARWSTYSLAEVYRRIFKRIYGKLSQAQASRCVDAASFLTVVRQEIFGKKGNLLIEETRAEFHARWASLLGLPRPGWRLDYTTGQLSAPLHDTFDAPHPGWKQARYHCPDVMIAADGPDAIRRGDYSLVLGELHMAFNTVGSACLVSQHPSPDTLRAFAKSDFGRPKLTIAVPKSWPHNNVRTAPMLVPADDWHLGVGFDSIFPDDVTILPVADMIVEQNGDQLVMRSREGRLSFDIADTFGELLLPIVADYLGILTPAQHTPRITIDRLVVCREAWRIPALELTFANIKDEAERFLGARRWARANGIPRFVFVKSPLEGKPVYLDFASTIYVDIFAKLVRRTIEESKADEPVSVTLTEMLPQLNQAWLHDSRGRTYTSELRFVALDLLAD